jgi:hypothetical protein
VSADKFEVVVETRGLDGMVLAASWEWDVPEGFQMTSPVECDRDPRLVVTIERMDSPVAVTEEGKP